MPMSRLTDASRNNTHRKIGITRSLKFNLCTETWNTLKTELKFTSFGTEDRQVTDRRIRNYKWQYSAPPQSVKAMKTNKQMRQIQGATFKYTRLTNDSEDRRGTDRRINTDNRTW